MSTPDPEMNATRRHWDEQATKYDQAKRRNDAYYRALKACFDKAVPEPLRGRILDVGCGTGQILASLNPREGLGIDLSERMIAAARAAFVDRSELQFEVMAAGQLQVGAVGRFDSVISADMLEHADDWRGAVSAMVAALRPGGIIAISTPNPAWAFPLWALEKLRLKMPEGPHRFVRARDVAEQLASLGCVDVSQLTHLLVPAHLAGAGPAISRMAAGAPLLKRLGVIQLITARRSSA